ncbi:MAG: hypothetical protein AAGE94_09010, partial [Acidobacteriota bacterium]
IAKDANWWFYQDTPMLFNAPYYIIFGEFLVGLPLVWIAIAHERRRQTSWAIGTGVFVGLFILAAYYLTWWLVGPCTGSVIQFACG